MSLRTEIRQTKPFDSLPQEVFLNVLRTADHLLRDLEGFLRAHGLSEPRYNVLRILRGAGEEGLPCLEIGERMVTRAPDVSRLIDGLVRAGLAARSRSTADRRVVRVRATARALRLLESIQEEVHALDRRALGHMSVTELKRLNRLLERARAGPRAPA